MKSELLVLETLAADKFWAVNKTIGRAVGIEEAVITAELLYKYTYWKKRGELDGKGGFFCTSSDLQSAIGVSDKVIGRLTASVVKQGLFTVKKRGVPAKNYWYPNFDKLQAILSSDDGLVMSSDPQMGVTGDSQMVLTGDPQMVVTITNNGNEQGKRKKNSAAQAQAPSLARRVTDLIGEAHKALTGAELNWIGHGSKYGQAVQKILAAVSRETDDEAKYKVIHGKCAAYVIAARKDEFLKRQGVTPLSLLSNWNKVHYTGKAGTPTIGKKAFPDYRTMTAEQIRQRFAKWNKEFTTLDLKANIAPESYERFTRDAGGYAPALVDILIEEVSSRKA